VLKTLVVLFDGFIIPFILEAFISLFFKFSGLFPIFLFFGEPRKSSLIADFAKMHGVNKVGIGRNDCSFKSYIT
jgi:hypothetical protein